jgi:hypothetical protein
LKFRQIVSCLPSLTISFFSNQVEDDTAAKRAANANANKQEGKKKANTAKPK